MLCFGGRVLQRAVGLARRATELRGAGGRRVHPSAPAAEVRSWGSGWGERENLGGVATGPAEGPGAAGIGAPAGLGASAQLPEASERVIQPSRPRVLLPDRRSSAGEGEQSAAGLELKVPQMVRGWWVGQLSVPSVLRVRQRSRSSSAK